MVSTEEEVALGVVAEVGEDLLIYGVVVVSLHLEVATVVAEDIMTVVGLGDVPEAGMYFVRLPSAPVNPSF